MLAATAVQLSTAAAPTGNVGFTGILATTAGGATASTATFTAGNLPGLPDAYTGSGLVNSGSYLSTNASPSFLSLPSAITVGSPIVTYFSFLYTTAVSAGQGGGLSFFNGNTELIQVGTGGTKPSFLL